MHWQVNLTNMEAGTALDFVVMESSLPTWLTVTPMLGRIFPQQTFSIVVEFNHRAMAASGTWDKNKNLEGA